MASTSTSHQISLSASTLTTASWDVFVSFRGTDTRTGFTSFLYHALSRHGIRIFMDDRELQSGEILSEALLSAIQNSKIYIVVLSERYASSRWRLDELVEIVKCFREFGRLIIPVFYKIDPSVVRHEKGSFQTAFENHEKIGGIGMDKLNKWRLTLSQIGYISGQHVDGTRSEVDIVNEVVDAVQREISSVTINVAKYPVGIDAAVGNITEWLTSSIPRGQYIGIYGMGGVGKTTLAKSVFNANFRSFDGSCFLANVTNVFTQRPQSLQEQLVADILKIKKPEIDSIDRGIELIRQRIQSKRVLIVVDDLSNTEQLDSLVAGPFAPGSVIILTRNKDLLDNVDVEASYQYLLKELSYADSKLLFNKHAFRSDNPSDTFLALSEQILHYAGGLPLAIKIFGSNLRNQPETEWERFIGRLKDVSHPDILNKLKISFDALVDDILKEMFLDIACFFVGCGIEDIVPILGSCYKDVVANIDRLMSRCLIKIDDYEKFSMHDLVRDMGWQIARQSSGKDELKKHTRIFGMEDICSVLDDIDDNEGTNSIKAMVVYDYNAGSYKVTFHTKTFKSMPKLRFLKIKDVNLTGGFERIFKNLTWLHWDNCPLKSLDSDFCPKNLVILELPSSQITRWNLTKDFANLKTLDLQDSADLVTTPDFGRLLCLESINLSFCSGLEEIHTTIGELKNLVSLDLSCCYSLSRLPDSVCKLTALEILHIRNCINLEELPEGLGNIISLTSLVVGSPLISELPGTIGRLTKLVELRLDVAELETLRKTICNFGSLGILDIRSCKYIEELLPYNHSEMLNLQLPPNLEQLIAINCDSMSKLPDLSNLKQLVLLDLKKCSSLMEISGLEELTSLLYLTIEGASMKRLPNLSNLQQLVLLNLKQCRNLIEIEGLEELTSIEQIILKGCWSILRLPNLSNLKQLKDFDLSKCYNLREIEGLEDLTSSRRFYIKGCNSSVVANNLTVFQIYSEFGHTIDVHLEAGEATKWMSHSGRRSTEAQINVCQYFSGLVLSFHCPGDIRWGDSPDSHNYIYSINNFKTTYSTTSKGILMVIVPRKHLLESCESYDEDTIFHVTAECRDHNEDDVNIGIHPLYKLPQRSQAGTLAKRKKVI